MAASKLLPRLVWIACVVMLFVCGALVLAIYAAPFDWLKPLADGLARDGALESFTPTFYNESRPFWLGLALVLLMGGSLTLSLRGKIQAALDKLLYWSPRRTLGEDLQELKALLRVEKTARAYILSLALITAFGAAIRALHLSDPMQHDEAYTFIAFASRPLAAFIKDYSLPNNHIFHSLLVHFAFASLGDAPWCIRLPAFLAGVLCIPAAYALGGQLYNRKVGLAGAALTAAAPALIDYSANARGYTLICLFTLLVAWLAGYLIRQPNRLAWGLLALCASLGFYTIPIMLYPFGTVVVWLFLSRLLGDVPTESRAAFWASLGACLAATALLTGLFYLPVVINSGVGALIHNEYIQPQDAAGLAEQILSRVISTAEQWKAQTPAFMALLSLAGFALSLVLHRRVSSYRAPLQLAGLVWIGLTLALQRVAPLARVWLFLLPLYLIWASAGVYALLKLLLPRRIHLHATLLLLVLAPLTPGLSLYASLVQMKANPAEAGVEEAVAIYFKDNLRPGDLVVVQAPMAAPLEYYFRRYRLPLDAFDRQRSDIHRLLVLVSSKYEQTLESVLARKGLAEYLHLASNARVAYSFKHATVYELSP